MKEEELFASPVYWIGGSPCSGKSTITDALVARFNLRPYRCDDAYYEHQHLVCPEREPIFSRLIQGSCDDIWMRPVSQQVDEEFALYREEFRFIVDDLAVLAADGPVIAEGAALLPELLASLGVYEHHAIWIVPTAEFQRTHYALREWRHEVLATCADPDQAWSNWMERDARFALAVSAEARSLGYRLIVVDGSRSIEDSIDDVARWFELSTDY